jgi:hypothetical protein
MEQPTDKPNAIKTPGEWAAIAENMNASMAEVTQQLRDYVIASTAKLLLVAYGGYSNEDADKKIQEMIENSQKL